MHALFSFQNAEHTQPPLISAATEGTQHLRRTNTLKTLTLIQHKLRDLSSHQDQGWFFFNTITISRTKPWFWTAQLALILSSSTPASGKFFGVYFFLVFFFLLLFFVVFFFTACAFLTTPKQIAFSRKHPGVPQGGESSHLISWLWLGLLQWKQANASGPHHSSDTTKWQDSRSH